MKYPRRFFDEGGSGGAKTYTADELAAEVAKAVAAKEAEALKAQAKLQVQVTELTTQLEEANQKLTEVGENGDEALRTQLTAARTELKTIKEELKTVTTKHTSLAVQFDDLTDKMIEGWDPDLVTQIPERGTVSGEQRYSLAQGLAPIAEKLMKASGNYTKEPTKPNKEKEKENNDKPLVGVLNRVFNPSLYGVQVTNTKGEQR